MEMFLVSFEPKFDFATLIAGLALLASIIIGVCQIKLSKKIEDFDVRKGEIHLTLIIYKYFSSFISSLDNIQSQNAKHKTDQESVLNHLTVCKNTLKEFGVLINNRYYVKLIEKYPDIARLEIRLIHRINSIEYSNGIQTIDGALYRDFWLLFNKIRDEKYSKIFETEIVKKLYDGLAKSVMDNPDILRTDEELRTSVRVGKAIRTK